MRLAIEQVQTRGEGIRPTRGWAAELSGVLLELTNPRARVSRTETRGKPFSCLGELCWYLAGSKDVGFITYYLSEYRKSADGNEIFGAYGPRLLSWSRGPRLLRCRRLNQLANVTKRLRANPVSRKAVVQLFDAADIVGEHSDVPCTSTLQFSIRSGRLQLLVNMRSNDVFWGMPHDIFAFTMLQEIMARTLAVELGSYKHVVGSLHLYAKNVKAGNQFLGEGWQSTDSPMPPMPEGDPWPAIKTVLRAESQIRVTGNIDDGQLTGIDPYWADLVRLLQIFRCKRDGNTAKIASIRDRMASNIYRPFIDNIAGNVS